MAGAQPAARRLLTEAVAADLYLTSAAFAAQKGAAGGLATLGTDGKLTAAQLPGGGGDAVAATTAASWTGTLTAGRLYRADFQGSVSVAGGATATAVVRAAAGTVTLASGNTAVSPTYNTGVTGTTTGTATLTPWGTLTVAATGTYTVGGVSNSTVNNTLLLITDVGAATGRTPFAAL